jgi:hypothetical protein
MLKSSAARARAQEKISWQKIVQPHESIKKFKA